MRYYVLDGRVLTPHFSGISVYVHHLLESMIPQLRKGERLILLLDGNRRSPCSHPRLIPFNTGHGVFSPFRNRWIGQPDLARLLHEADPAWGANPAWGATLVYHSTYPTLYIHHPIPRITTLYDLIPLEYPRNYPLKTRILYPYFLNRAVHHSDSLIALSETTADRLTVRYPGISITTIYPGPGEWIETPKTTDNDSRWLPPPYFLYVGAYRPHKNVDELLQAYQMMDHDAPNLVMVGLNSKESRRLKQQFTGTPWADKIIIPENLPDPDPRLDSPSVDGQDDLPGLKNRLDAVRLNDYYRGCLAVIIPSLSEGFGFPAVEAARCGAKLICADRPIFHETVGDYAEYYPPGKPGRLAELMIRIIKHGNFGRSFISAGGGKLPRDYSWDECAAQTLDLYRSLVNSHP